MIVAVMVVLALMPTAVFGATGPDIAAKYDKGAKTVTVTVNGVTEKVTNVNNNSTVTVEVNGWKITLDAKNDVATIKSKEQLTPAEILADDVIATVLSNDGIDGLKTFRMEQTWNKTTYHCGYDQGGPRVVPTIYTGLPELDVTKLKNNTKIWLNLVEVPGTTKWELVSVEINGAIYTDPVCPICGSTEWVSFSNNSGVPDGKNMQLCHKAHPTITIVKNWTDDNPGNIVPLFDIYQKVDGDWVLFKANVKAGEKIEVEFGVYKIHEQKKEGYIEQEDQIIVIDKYGQNGSVYFVNEPEGGKDGSLSFEKRVEGKNIIEWLMEKYDNDVFQVMDILGGLEFYLDGPEGNYGPVTPDYDGKVVFDSVNPGTYILSEEITGGAVGIFKKMDDIEITIAEGDNNYFVLGGTVKGNIEGQGADIKIGDTFTIVNGYGLDGYTPSINGLGYYSGHLNNGGDLFYIGVTSTRTGHQFDSFCAYAGAKSFSDSGYMVAQSLNDLRYLQAFNYIADNFGADFGDTYTNGSVSSARRIAQTVVWYLLGEIDIESGFWGDVLLTEAEKAAVEATIANYEGYVGSGSVIDVVYMVSTENSDDPENNQPQIVPIFGTFYVQNEPDGGGIDGGVSFNKVMLGGDLSYFDFFMATGTIPEFSFDLFKYNDGTGEYDIYGTYTTDFDGAVAVNNLNPGKYVFKEVLPLFDIPGIGEYNLVWNAIYPNGADGLYFEITANGDTVWRDTNEEVPTVDNKFFDKSYVQFVKGSPDSFTGVGEVGEIFANGFLFYPHGKAAAEAYVIYEKTNATCTLGGVLWFYYNDGGVKGEPLFSLGIEDPLGHDFALNAMGDGLCCTRGDYDRGWWELSADELALYHELGGLGGL